jgi:hypothetical protein
MAKDKNDHSRSFYTQWLDIFIYTAVARGDKRCLCPGEIPGRAQK